MQNTDYLKLAQAILDDIRASREAPGGAPSSTTKLEEAMLAVQIAQVEATQQLAYETHIAWCANNVDCYDVDHVSGDENTLSFSGPYGHRGAGKSATAEDQREEKCVHGVYMDEDCGDCPNEYEHGRFMNAICEPCNRGDALTEAVAKLAPDQFDDLD